MSMPGNPLNWARMTNHRVPRYQLYQPGFNPSNSCWLHGGWITVRKDAWKRRKAVHTTMARIILAESKTQHHRDLATPVEKLTPMQRTAWEHSSGTSLLSCRSSHGHVLHVSVGLASDRITESSLKWLAEDGYRILSKTVHPCTEALAAQIEELRSTRPELIDECVKPVNVHETIIKQNTSRK